MSVEMFKYWTIFFPSPFFLTAVKRLLPEKKKKWKKINLKFSCVTIVHEGVGTGSMNNFILFRYLMCVWREVTTVGIGIFFFWWISFLVKFKNQMWKDAKKGIKVEGWRVVSIMDENAYAFTEYIRFMFAYVKWKR